MLKIKDSNYYPLPSIEVDDDIIDVKVDEARVDETLSQRERIDQLLSTAGHEPPSTSRTKENVTLKGR